VANRVRVSFDSEPIWPLLEEIDPEQVVFQYDDEDDLLKVHFFGSARPALSVLSDRYGYLRVDPETSTVVGIYIEQYLNKAVLEAPRLLYLASVTEIPEARIEKVRRQMPEARLKKAAIASIFPPPKTDAQNAVFA
jgi:hypothetical protein